MLDKPCCGKWNCSNFDKLIFFVVGVNTVRGEEVLYYKNYDLVNVVTPVRYKVLDKLLKESKFDCKERRFLVNGFKNGFSIGYQGSPSVKLKAPNLKLTVGSEDELWNKVIKEVQELRYAGPYLEEDIPFDNYIQSPIGLVPKDNGKKTRLIFHLSYPRRPNSPSVNANTPDEICSVKYPDFSQAINLCLKEGRYCRLAKSDMQSAFRVLGVVRRHWRYLLLKAKSPFDGKILLFPGQGDPIWFKNFMFTFSTCVQWNCSHCETQDRQRLSQLFGRLLICCIIIEYVQ